MALKVLSQKTIAQKFKKFCQHSTLHGVFYFHGDSWRWVHSIWILILSFSLCLCCYLSHMIWNKFVLDPTLTVVETTQYPTASIPFPSVTVCDTEPVYGPNTEYITQLLSLRGYNRTQIVEFFRIFSDMKQKAYEPKPYVKKMHSLLDDLGYPLSKLMFMLRRPCSQLLVECNWRSRLYNCSDMFRHVNTVMGHCCQFDIPYFKSKVGELTNFVSGVQSTEALDIVIDGQKVTPDGQHSQGRVNFIFTVCFTWIFIMVLISLLYLYITGFISLTYRLQLYVTDTKDHITFVNNAVLLTPAALFDVNVYLWVIDSSENVKALDLATRKCVIDSDPRATSYQGCVARTILNKVVQLCKCLPQGVNANDLDVEDYSICTWDRLLCIHENLERVQADIRAEMSQHECYQKCDYVQYETEVEFVRNRRNLQGLNTKSSVIVHYSETTCMKYRREVLYTWDQMLANLGGIFGLCLGGSIISVIEIIWFLLDLLITAIYEIVQSKFDNKQSGSKKSKNQVFTVSGINTKNPNMSTKTSKKNQVMRFKFTN